MVQISGDCTRIATAKATVKDGLVVSLSVTDAGTGCQETPGVLIASPPFMTTLNIAASKVKVTQHVVLGHSYVLESSFDLTTWTLIGYTFTTQNETLTGEFDVETTRRYYRILEIP